MTETRHTFEGLAGWEISLWYALSAISTGVFLYGLAVLVRKYRRGRGPRTHPGQPRWRRVRHALAIILTHRWIRRADPMAGLGHALIFYGFLTLLAGTIILAVQEHIAGPIFGVNFWHGSFYLGYSLALDVMGLALGIGLAIMAVRRYRHPAQLDYARLDGGVESRRRYVRGDWLLLGVLAALMLGGFLLEGLRIAQRDPSFERWAIVGWTIAQGLRAIGISGETAAVLHHILWWAHGLLALAFVASIPFTKAVHMIAAPANQTDRDPDAGKILPPTPADAPSTAVGYQRIGDLSPTHLLSLDACTKCGRCQSVCPAAASGRPLSPRDVILDLRELAEGAGGLRAALDIEPCYPPDVAIADRVRSESIWSCTQCMACVDVCPVGIEHVPIINQIRRGLVEQGELDEGLQATFEAVLETGNSFGEPRRKRPRWTRELDFEVKDIRRERAELLWFVGDYAAFDPRNQRATRALAQTLAAAGVDFGILFDAERTAGCDVRRAGEEALWSELATTNVATIEGCEFDRIFSSDPHTFHTLRNEYPMHGGEWTVLHHSQLLLELIVTGRLVPRRRLGYRVTYHDPCTLGRYNRVFDAPRELLEAIGCEIVEMPRNRANSFCCGAGGGQIWMRNPAAAPDAKRPSEQRIDEAAALGSLDHFVVACPKDVTMYEDAIKTSGHGGELVLRELSELVWESVDPVASVSADQLAGRSR